MDLFAGQQQRQRPREQTCGYSEGKRGWDELINVETYTLPYIKQKTSGNLLYGAGSSTVTTQKCGRGEGSSKERGTYVYLWLIHVYIWQKPIQYCNYSPIKTKLIKKSKVIKDICISQNIYFYLLHPEQIFFMSKIYVGLLSDAKSDFSQDENKYIFHEHVYISDQKN